MGFAGYVSVCVQLSQNRQTTKTEQADKHTRKETTTKTTKENRGKNTNGNMQSVNTWGKKEKKSNEAESLKHMKIKYPTHQKMAM
jgi:hypothetical protein